MGALTSTRQPRQLHFLCALLCALTLPLLLAGRVWPRGRSARAVVGALLSPVTPELQLEAAGGASLAEPCPSTGAAGSRPDEGWTPAAGSLGGHAWGSLLQAHENVPLSPVRLSVRHARTLLNATGAHAGARVLIVAGELSHTPAAFGGIGVFCVQLARLLVSAGCSVTILFSQLDTLPASGATEVAAFAAWGVHLVGLPALAASANRGHLRYSYRVLQFLLAREDDFDVIHFHEYNALGFLPLLAKEQGWAIPRSATVVGLHGSSAWTSYVNGHVPFGDGALSLMHCERRAVELADHVWAPSEYMAGFVQSRRWSTRQPIWVAPYPVEGQLQAPPTPGPLPATRPELVFFGRLEPRKGAVIFVEALIAAERVVGTFSVTFLGRSIFAEGYGDMRAWISERLQRTRLQVQFLEGFSREQAIAYLSEPGRLACMPSLVDNSPLVVYEALALGVPFLSSSTGGIPELVHAEDAASVLLPPSSPAWARKITAIMAEGEVVRRPAPHHSLPENAAAHIALLEAVLAGRREGEGRAVLPAKLPRVSVIVTTHNRGASVLQQTLDALEAQTYPKAAMEVIVVDDGSTLPDALAALQGIGSRLASSGTGRLLTIQNQYLGAARNRGAEVASGDFYAFLDDDDVPVGDYVERLVTVAEHTRADVLSTFFATFVSDGAPTGATPHSLYMFLGQALSTSLLENAFGGANIFVRKQAFDRVGGFSELVGVGYEDYEFLVKAALVRVRHDVVPAPLLWVRHSPGSMSTTVLLTLGMQRVLAAVQSALSDDRAALDMSDTIGHVVGLKLATEKARGLSSAARLASASMFSGQQGVFNMRYGAFVVPRLPRAEAGSAQGFPPSLQQWALARAGEAAAAGVVCATASSCTLKADADYTAHLVWDGSGANWPAWRAPSFSKDPWPFIDASSMHPGVAQVTALVIMRSWRSFLHGDAALEISFEFGVQGCGDGVCLALLHDGQAVWHECNDSMSGRVVVKRGRVQLKQRLTTGSILALVVDPLSSGDCDTTQADLTIEML